MPRSESWKDSEFDIARSEIQNVIDAETAALRAKFAVLKSQMQAQVATTSIMISERDAALASLAAAQADRERLRVALIGVLFLLDGISELRTDYRTFPAYLSACAGLQRQRSRRRVNE